MFRKMRRFKQQLENDEVKKILKDCPRGVLSVIGDDGYPYGFPMDFIYEESENTIYFHSAKEGHKIDALKKCDKASFCVYDGGYKKEGDWTWTIKSVVAFGKIEFVDDIKVTEKHCRNLGMKYYPSAEAVDKEIERDLNRVQMLAFRIEYMTGKKVHEA